MKKILFAASEAVPFIKTGGLADVVGSLPKYFDRKRYDVRVILPKYACMEEAFEEQLKPVTRFYLQLGWRRQYAGILKARADGIQYYFVDNEFYFGGDHIYGEIHEDAERFAFFSKAVLETIDVIGFIPDILHCNDWQTGLIPALLENQYRSRENYKNIRTVFSIHNIRFQGRWRIPEVRDVTGLPADVFLMKGMEAYGEANYLKGGIVYSDAVTTVSKSYSMEIMTPESGEGLDGVLRYYSFKLFGILNGLDYVTFDPAKDVRIPYHYDSTNVIEVKKENKRELQEIMGLPQNPDVFLIGMVSRMTGQKGFDLIAYILDEFLAVENVQFAILGAGEGRFEDMFRYFAEKYPDKLSANIGYSEDRAHLIYAGADAFLMPSLFEPCGLSQLMSLRYGTVPIVRETGGLKDTVEPYNRFTQEGIGFSFRNYNAHEMADAIRKAMEVFYTEKEHWKGIIERGMNRNFSWNSSVEEYEKLYESICQIPQKY